jgi:hypothetical protein
VGLRTVWVRIHKTSGVEMIACGVCLFTISNILAVVATCVYPITYVITKIFNKVR